MRLEGRVALITGAARGIGAAIAELFVQEGAQVVIADVLAPEGGRVAQTLSADNERAIFVRLDVRLPEDWSNAVQTALDTFHKLDILINNAGVTRPETIEDCTVEQWRQVMDVNATSTFLGIKSVISAMKQSGGGSIVNVSSIWGLVGTADSVAYQASKGAVRVLTKGAAIQLARYGIRVNSIHPGVIQSELSAPLPTHLRLFKRLLALSPVDLRRHMLRSLIDRQGQPLEVARGVLYLASEESSYTTGAELVIDGGYTAQ